MEIFSIDFWVIWITGLLVYYTLGQKIQWQVLTFISILTYILSITKFPIVLIVVWLSTYFGGRIVSINKSHSKYVFWGCVFIDVVILLLGREVNLFALLGNSYFTLKAIGYLIDVNRGGGSESNIFKYLLYLIYWPSIYEGPFNRIEEFNKSISNEVPFCYSQVLCGLQRFLWGMFKKLVIAERLSPLVSEVVSTPSGKGGLYVIIAIVTYAIQLYADFSGFMDMMIGMSMSFGIILPENFKQPYFSKSIPEFWRRWHITLGLWFRDYVMFPLTTCNPVKKMGKVIRKKNRIWGKCVPVIIGTFVVWILTGIWHGFNKNYLVWGLYYAIIMCVSYIYQSFFPNKKIIVNSVFASISIIKTIGLVLIADSIVCVEGLHNVLLLWKEIIFNFRGGTIKTLTATGFSFGSTLIIGYGIILMLINSVIKEKGGNPQGMLNEANAFIKWGFYYMLIFFVFIFGIYGPQYDTSQFMYMQF